MKIVSVMSASVDGRIAPHPLADAAMRLEAHLTSPEDQEALKQAISESDAVVIGARSIVADGTIPEWPGPGGKVPPWYLLTRTDVPDNLPFWRQTAIPRVIVSPQPQALPKHEGRVTNLVCGAENPAAFLADHLRSQGLRQVLLLGGGMINHLFFAAGLVDFLRLTVSPVIIGQFQAPRLVDPPLPQTIQLSLTSSHHKGSHVFLNYQVHNKGR